jgi:hypothetical protein
MVAFFVPGRLAFIRRVLVVTQNVQQPGKTEIHPQPQILDFLEKIQV